MKKPTVLLTARDLSLLEFLWKWKVATTAALIQRYFRDVRPNTAYVRLWQLRRGGFIQWKSDSRTEKFVLTLTSRGFDAVRDSIEVALKEEGFASEHINHDMLVSAVHLGDWLLGEPEGVSLLSEQQLRRFNSEHLPSWVPDVNSHRSDGYWYIPDGNSYRLVSLEVELSLKGSVDYDRVGRFYSRQENLNGILWVVSRPWVANHIHSLLTRGQSQSSANHNFIYVSEFKRVGWQAEIRLGNEKGKTVREFLYKTPQITSQENPNEYLPILMLDARKSPRKSMITATRNEISRPHS